jgi:L-threonylcarbamoyladenylate synthase
MNVVWFKSEPVSVDANCYKELFSVPTGKISTPVYFVKLELKRKGHLLSENTYWLSPLEKPDYSALANLETVAVRIPNHPVTLALLKEFNSGVVGPSANTSGKPSPTTAQHVADDLDGKIDIILNAGATTIGVESTVIDVTLDPPMILRFGGLSREEIENAIGMVQVAVKEESLKCSPGTRHRHYAPNAEVILIEEGNTDELERRYNEIKSQGKQIGVVTHSISISQSIPSIFAKSIGPSVQQFARYLFASLRELDEQHVDVILVERVASTGLGAAVMDRLNKAAHFSKTPSN